jgi:tetratricopeptide (TPR) repeat protein
LQEAIDTLKDNPGFSDATADNAKTDENLNTAELIENGDTALKAKKYKEAYSLYDKARNGGDINATKKIDAMIKLGIKQIEKLKIKEAVEILQPLSDGGEKDAQFELAMIYIDGYDVGKVKNKFIDYKNGVKLLQAIAEDGDLVALANIGWCYEVGRGYKVDYQKALDYYQKALDNGYQMNDWISKRIKTCESILIGPKATIGKAWVSQLDDQTIVVHFHIQIKNCKNKKVSFIFQTKQARLNYSVDVKPTDDNYEWRDYCYFINETDVKNKLLFGISHLETELIIKDNNRNVLCSKIMKYKVHHEARLFHKNKLTLYK